MTDVQRNEPEAQQTAAAHGEDEHAEHGSNRVDAVARLQDEIDAALADVSPAVEAITDDLEDASDLSVIRHEVDTVFGTVAPAGPPAFAPTPAEELQGIDSTLRDVLGDQPPTPAASVNAPPRETIGQVDAALADDAVDLLNGTFESVSTILEDVFDEHEQPIEESFVDRAVLRDQVDDPDEQTEPEPIVEPFIAAVTDVDLTDDLIEIPVVTEAEPSPEDGAGASAVLDAAAVAEPVIEPEEAAPEPPAPISESLPERAPKPAPAAEPKASDATAVPDHGAPTAGADDAAAVSDDAANDDDDDLEHESLLQRLEPLVVSCLTPLSYPLRKVPPRLRPVVDWIALSLVFWVPVVWVIVLLVL